MEFKKVTKEEFDEFVKNYPNDLDWDVCGISEPPLGSYNDFSDGKTWPDSMVTKVLFYDGSDYHEGKTKEYYIRREKGDEDSNRVRY